MLCKSKDFPRRYKRKREWVFFSEHSVEKSHYSHPWLLLLMLLNDDDADVTDWCECYYSCWR